jgi:hypothetical protein
VGRLYGDPKNDDFRWSDKKWRTKNGARYRQAPTSFRPITPPPPTITGPMLANRASSRAQIPALGLNSARAHSAMARFQAGRAIDFPSRNHRMTSSARTNKNWLISTAT